MQYRTPAIGGFVVEELKWRGGNERHIVKKINQSGSGSMHDTGSLSRHVTEDFFRDYIMIRVVAFSLFYTSDVQLLFYLHFEDSSVYFTDTH